MGEVYRATDSKLRREVAIKVLPAAFTADPERLARFEREAQLLAQLQHPHIASIYGLEEAGGTRALVMELVDGPTLDERLALGALPLEEALSIARQIAEALEAAHGKGIVHRDLKPQNIKVPFQGAVKVLDFGLAKAMDAAAGGSSAGDLARSPTMMNSPTLTAVHGTQLGTILGTAAYMAPEQAKGHPIDKRADIWAFGVVLFEMLSGGRLFSGDSVAETLAGVLKTDIDLKLLAPGTPAAIRQLVRRCLERNPRNRLHDIADARIVIDEALSGSGEAVDPSAAPTALSTPVPPRRPSRAIAVALAAGALLGVVATALWSGKRGVAVRPEAKPVRFEIAPPEKAGFVPGIAISPDGRQVAFVARNEAGQPTLWVRPFDSLAARELPSTEGARYPFWAPDSRRIGFFGQRSLKWIDSRGGTAIDLVSTTSVQNVRGGAWGADDIVIYAPMFSGPILAVPLRGGQSTPATELPADGSLGTMRFPSFLPDGHRFVFYASQGSGTEPGSLHLGRLGSVESKLLGPATSSAVFAPPGYLIFCRGDAVVAQRFDDRREELTGDPIPLGITMGGSISVSGHRSLGVAGDGTMIYRADKRGVSEIVWANRKGEVIESVTGVVPTWFYGPRLSPDSRTMLVAQYETNGKVGQFWVHDLARKVASRLTFDDGDNFLGVWLGSDGRDVLYNCMTPAGTGGICRVPLERPGEAQVWLQGTQTSSPTSATRDGRQVIYEQEDAQGRIVLWDRAFEGDQAPRRLSPEGVTEQSADLSPDGAWLAYISDAAGEFSVYIRRLSGGGAIRISPGGGTQPLWRRDGRELYYIDPLGRLMAVPIEPGDPLRPGAATPLFDPHLEDAFDRQYDVSPDGQRFLLNRRLAADGAPLVVVLDWTTLLESQAR